MKEVKVTIKLPENAGKENVIVTMHGIFPAKWKDWGFEAIKNDKECRADGRWI